MMDEFEQAVAGAVRFVTCENAAGCKAMADQMAQRAKETATEETPSVE